MGYEMSVIEQAQRPDIERGNDPKVLALSAMTDAWPLTLMGLGVGFAAMVALYFSTVTSAIHLWNNSAAYNYAYLILPISLALIWMERGELARAKPVPTFWGAAVGAGFSLIWLVGEYLGIDEGRHIAFVGMMQGLAVGLLGWRLYRFLAFPLLYLFFLVPTGTFLLTPLQSLAHWANVVLLKASGVPVYAEGILIQVPAGSFLVEPGCAGLNFFLVAFALSLLYGRLTYASTFARVMCVVAALAISIIANIIRIYLIIGLAQFTDRRIDITADHIVYGWGFFGVVMLLAMWAGNRINAAPARPHVLPEGQQAPVPVSRIPLVTAVFVTSVAFSPLVGATTQARPALESYAHEWMGRLGVPTSADAGRATGE